MGDLQPDELQRRIVRRAPPGTSGSAGLVWVLVFMLAAALGVIWSASRDDGPDASVVNKVVKALGGGGGRVRDGSATTAQPRPVPTPGSADGAAAGTDAAPSASPSALGGGQILPAVGDRLRVANTDGLGVVLRTEPREDARVPRGLAEGARVTVLALEGGGQWVRVRGENGLEGWVPARYLAPTQQ